MNHEGWGVQRWAIHLSQLLNAANPPDRYRFDIGALAKDFSKSSFPTIRLQKSSAPTSTTVRERCCPHRRENGGEFITV